MHINWDYSTTCAGDVSLNDAFASLPKAKCLHISLDFLFVFLFDHDREKEKRKSDLSRLEGELELQIKSIEERAKSEKIKHHNSNCCDSMNSPIIPKKFTDSIDISNNYLTDSKSSVISLHYEYLNQNKNESLEQDSYKIELQNVLSILAQREFELKTLKDQLIQQEAQLTMDKHELISQEEEKQNLYSQLNVMRTTMERLNKTNDYLCSALHRESVHRPSRTSPSSAFSECMLSEDADDNTACASVSSFLNVLVMHQFFALIERRYRCIVRSYFRKIDGVVLMYAVDQPDTFTNIKYWMEMIKESTSEVNVPILLVGNKVDLRNTSSNSTKESYNINDDIKQDESHKYITYEMGANVAKLHQVSFIETSVLSKHNITEAIELLTEGMKLNEDKQVAVVTLTTSSSTSLERNIGKKSDTNRTMCCT
ncbi:putative rab [Schistosoma mansoni]|uniref:putative rab n=1 Tax=Schistosoma mansoni TaxID=6183 RepID=UPI00022DC2AF|nr:putative rab [Schistosoma mansoni]|eukprot:XP_018650946.1 putative rab [Schistosoma mansoni]